MRVFVQSSRVWGVIVALWVWVVRGVRAEQVSVSQGLLNQLGIKLPTTGDLCFFVLMLNFCPSIHHPFKI
jgi:hypothetical protein